MNKVELQAKADSLVDEINFLRAFYDAVSIPASHPDGALERGKRWVLGTSGNITGTGDIKTLCSLGTVSDANSHLRHFCHPVHGQQP
jgi:hypothetical protein